MKSLQDQGSVTKFSYKDLEMLILPTLILLLTRLTLSELKIYRWVRKKMDGASYQLIIYY